MGCILVAKYSLSDILSYRDTKTATLALPFFEKDTNFVLHFSNVLLCLQIQVIE